MSHQPTAVRNGSTTAWSLPTTQTKQTSKTPKVQPSSAPSRTMGVSPQMKHSTLPAPLNFKKLSICSCLPEPLRSIVKPKVVACHSHTTPCWFTKVFTKTPIVMERTVSTNCGIHGDTIWAYPSPTYNGFSTRTSSPSCRLSVTARTILFPVVSPSYSPTFSKPTKK